MKYSLKSMKTFISMRKTKLIRCIIDVKFASGIKNINFGFYPYTDVC